MLPPVAAVLLAAPILITNVHVSRSDDRAAVELTTSGPVALGTLSWQSAPGGLAVRVREASLTAPSVRLGDVEAVQAGSAVDLRVPFQRPAGCRDPGWVTSSATGARIEFVCPSPAAQAPLTAIAPTPVPAPASTATAPPPTTPPPAALPTPPVVAVAPAPVPTPPVVAATTSTPTPVPTPVAPAPAAAIDPSPATVPADPLLGRSAASTGPGGAQLLGIGVLLLTLAAAALWGARRRRQKQGIVEVIETTSLGPKSQLIVARVGGELVLLGTSDAGPRHLLTLAKGPDGTLTPIAQGAPDEPAPGADFPGEIASDPAWLQRMAGALSRDRESDIPSAPRPRVAQSPAAPTQSMARPGPVAPPPPSPLPVASAPVMSAPPSSLVAGAGWGSQASQQERDFEALFSDRAPAPASGFDASLAAVLSSGTPGSGLGDLGSLTGNPWSSNGGGPGAPIDEGDALAQRFRGPGGGVR